MATRIGQLAQEMAQTNPWWRDPDWAGRDPDLRAAQDQGIDYAPDVLRDLTPGGLYLLRGPRRVGKTVAVKRKIVELLDSGIPATCVVRAAVDGWAGKDIRTLVQNTALPPLSAGQARWWFLDEISATSGEWDRHVKWLRDNHEEFARGCVVLTGSDAAELTRAAGTLAGRRGEIDNSDRTLLPMGFRTFVRLRVSALPDDRVALDRLRADHTADVYARLLPWLDELVRSWDIYLQYGGFPTSVGACLRGRPVPRSFLDTMMDVISRDAFGASRLSRTQSTSLLERVWTSMASPINLSAIADDVGTTSETVARHVEYLRDAYLAWNCPQRKEGGWLPLDRAREKVYGIDPLVARLAHLRNPERADIDPTVLTEMMLGVAVHRAGMESGRMWEDDQRIYYVRTPSRKEIDFVSPDFAGAAIEAKYTTGGGWRRAAATVNASQWEGIFATRNVLDIGDDGAWAVPASILAYLIDT